METIDIEISGNLKGTVRPKKIERDTHLPLGAVPRERERESLVTFSSPPNANPVAAYSGVNAMFLTKNIHRSLRDGSSHGHRFHPGGCRGYFWLKKNMALMTPLSLSDTWMKQHERCGDMLCHSFVVVVVLFFFTGVQ